MKKYITAALYLIAMLSLPLSAQADDMADLRESVQVVREKLVVLLVTTDKEKQAERIKDIQLLSQDIDAKLKALLESEKTPGDVKDKLTEFQLVWAEFRRTRDKVIIPNVVSGDASKIKEAKVIARTVQAERFQKMQALLQ